MPPLPPPQNPNAALNVSAACCPVWACAAADPWLHASTAAWLAWNLVPSCWQMKSETTLMFCADPCVNSVLSAGSKLSSLRPSKPAPKTTVGLVAVPRSRLDVLSAAAAAAAAAGTAEEEEEEEAAAAAAAVELLELALALGSAAAAAASPAQSAAAGAALAAEEGDDEAAETPATAASISAAVASSTSRFWLKMHPSASFASSHELPAPVVSPTWPGLKVPDLSATCGSPPMEAICLASSRVMFLLVAAALSEAGSWLGVVG